MDLEFLGFNKKKNLQYDLGVIEWDEDDKILCFIFFLFVISRVICVNWL